MKRIACIILTACMAHVSMAQSKPEAAAAKAERKANRMEERAKTKANALAYELKLNDDQRNRLNNLLLKRMTEVSEVRKQQKASPTPEGKEKMKALKQQYKKELQAILTPEQYKQWEQNRKHSPERQRVIDANPNMPEEKSNPSDID
jgi:hypothetical protein